MYNCCALEETLDMKRRWTEAEGNYDTVDLSIQDTLGPRKFVVTYISLFVQVSILNPECN